MHVNDNCYGPGLSKRLFHATGSSRSSEIVKEWLSTDEGKSFLKDVENSGQVIKIKRCRQREPPIDYSKAPWLIMLEDLRINDPTTKQGKTFRRRFRIPYPMFGLVCERSKTSTSSKCDDSNAASNGGLSINADLFYFFSGVVHLWEGIH